MASEGREGAAGTGVGVLDGLETCRGRRGFGDLSRPGLLLVDPQRIFCDPTSPAWGEGWRTAGPRAVALVRRAQELGLPTLATRHVHPPGDEGGLIGRFWGRLQRDGDPLAELTADCAALGLPTFDKSRHSALESPEVAAVLEGCDGLVLMGVQTHLCVLGTALDAPRLGLVPIVVADATAARTEAEHRAGLRVLGSGHAHLATAEEVSAWLG